MGAMVNVEQADVTCFEDMKRVISIRDEPIRGVVYAAMGLNICFLLLLISWIEHILIKQPGGGLLQYVC